MTMDFIKNWAFAVSAAAIAGAVVLMLAPDGALNKSVRTAVSLFLIISMLSPFVNGVDLPSFSLDAEMPSEIDMSEAVAEQLEVSLRAKITEILSVYGINAEKINIDISAEDETLTVNKIEIIADGSTQEAEKRIKDEIGADVKIEVRG